MRIVFFGTPDYVLPVLDSLRNKFKTKTSGSPIVAVVTQKPLPAGRKQKLTYSAVDKWAHDKNIPVFYDPNKMIVETSANFGILASYGAIIPKQVIDHFPNGILNIHPSALPKFRGSSPVQATLITSTEKAIVTIMLLDEKLDHGPIISQFEENIMANDTTNSLRKRLFEKSAEVLITLVPAYLAGKITPRAQNHKLATYTSLVTKQNGFIPPNYLQETLEGKSIKDKWKIGFMKMKSTQASLIKEFSLQPTPQAIERFIRAMQPWPQAWTQVIINSKLKTQNSKRLKILKAHIEEKKLVLDEVQLEGKNPITWKQFTQGYPKTKFSD